MELDCIKAVEKYFEKKMQYNYRIVNCRVWGLPNSTGYGPSKSALNNLAESLYFDFKRSDVRGLFNVSRIYKIPMTDKNDFKMPF